MIRRMTAADIPRVAEIHVMGWRSAYRGIVSDDYLFNELLVSKRIVKLEEYFKQDPEFYVYDDGIIKAFLTAAVGSDDDMPDTLVLEALYVDTFMQKCGIGSELVLLFEKIAAERNYKRVYLWTFEGNANARAFYEKRGYTHDGTRKVIGGRGWVGVRYVKEILS